MTPLTFTIHSSVDEQVYFNLKDSGGRKLLTSRNYRSLTECTNEIYRMQQYKDFVVEDDLQAERYCYRFSLQTCAGKTVAKSVKYYSASEMELVKCQITSNLVKATIEDHSTSVRFFRRATLKR